MQAGCPAKLLITLATYNERDNIEALIREIHQYVPTADILVIDDNSPDGTGHLVAGLAERDPRIRVLHRPGKLGLGTAIIAGLRYAEAQGYDLVINMDADFSHPPRYIPDLLAGMDRRDVMIGSRYVPGGGTRNWPRIREWVSRAVNTLVRFFLRLGVRDASGAFRCYRVVRLRDVQLDRICSRGYSFQQEMLYRCRLAHCRLGETPITFENRRAGKSKVNLREAVRSFATLLYLGVRSMLGVDKNVRKAVLRDTRPNGVRPA